MTYSLGKWKKSVSQKFEYFLKEQSKKDLQNRNDLQSRFNYALNTWLGLLLHELLHQCDVAWIQSARGTAEMLALIAAFNSSVVFGQMLLIFAFNMLWYSTPWTAPPFSNSVSYSLCEGC